MGNSTTIEEYTKYEVLNEEDSSKLRIICRILAIICNIPCFLSIFVFIFEDSKLKLNQKIQLRLCISIVLYESSHYIPVSTNYQWICYIQCILSFGILIIISYLAMIHTYIALIMFSKPKLINSGLNKFFIHIFPYLFFLAIILYIIKVPKLNIFFGFTVYPDDEDPSRIFNYLLVFIFLLICIINNIILIHKIKKFISKLSNIDHFAKEKLYLFKKKLIFNIFGIIFVFHYALPVGILTSLKIVSGAVFFKLKYFIYIYANKAILGIIFWFIYIFNINFLHKFLILIRLQKKEKYKEHFEKEEKILEYSIDESTRAEEAISINMDDLDHVHSINRNSIKSNYEDEEL